jgi:hypothetical protein
MGSRKHFEKSDGRKSALDYVVSARLDRLMNSRAFGLRVAALIFAFVTLAHLVRLIAQAHVTIGSQTIPIWVSAPLVVISGLLSLWMWRLSNQSE